MNYATNAYKYRELLYIQNHGGDTKYVAIIFAISNMAICKYTHFQITKFSNYCITNYSHLNVFTATA
jgi:hypothetical protein